MLSRKTVTVSIDELGFRETTPIQQAQTFTLGDSYTFGLGVKDEDIWGSLVEQNLHHPVFNLGITNTSPKQQLELLKFLFEKYGENLAVNHVLWLIFEGNDLEDDYSDANPEVKKSKKNTGLANKIHAKLGQVLTDIKRNTVIQQLRSGRARIVFNNKADSSQNAYEIDGVRLTTPFYFSDTLGPRLFSSQYLERATKPRTYVMNHSNRTRADMVFQEMRQLANDHRLPVTVILAPTAVRVHGPYYKGFPTLSDQPHFLNYVEDLAGRSGFQVVNLYDYFLPYAPSRLLYFRDDDHWNPEGHAVAAEAIIQQVFGKQVALAPIPKDGQ